MTNWMKWSLTVLGGIAAGLVAYAQVHKGPPVTGADYWDLLIVTLTTSGIGTTVAGVRKGIDKMSEKP